MLNAWINVNVWKKCVVDYTSNNTWSTQLGEKQTANNGFRWNTNEWENTTKNIMAVALNISFSSGIISGGFKVSGLFSCRPSAYTVWNMLGKNHGFITRLNSWFELIIKPRPLYVKLIMFKFHLVTESIYMITTTILIL